MKRMTKALSLFLAVLMLALPLAGCSSTVSSAVTSEESSQADSQPESSLPEEEVEKADINIVGLKRPHRAGYAPDHGEQ